MNKNKIIYKSFLNFAGAMALKQGTSLRVAKKIISQNFEKHPYEKMISKLIKKDIQDHGDLESLFKQCVTVCEDFGPNRDYMSLVLVLKNISNQSKGAKGKASLAYVEKFHNEIARINVQIPSPPVFNMVLESRSLIEWTSMFCIYPLIPRRNKVKNNPVLLIPPYLGNDNSFKFLRKYLESTGFKTYNWGIGTNLIDSSYIPKLVKRIEEIYEKHQEKVSLVGWSGGGIFAKILANRYPNKISQIVTIGAPIWGVNELNTPVMNFMEFFRGKTLKKRNQKFIQELEKIPAVPITCIYTKTDGLVPWKNCMEAETLREDIKNIEVFGSHCGMGANASVLLTVANSLMSNFEGEQRKKMNTKIERLFFPEFWKQKGTSKFTELFLKS